MTVSISEEVDILGTTFTKGMIVEVPVQQLSELIESGKAQVVEASKTGEPLEETGSQKDTKGTRGTKKQPDLSRTPISKRQNQLPKMEVLRGRIQRQDRGQAHRMWRKHRIPRFSIARV